MMLGAIAALYRTWGAVGLRRRVAHEISARLGLYRSESMPYPPTQALRAPSDDCFRIAKLARAGGVSPRLVSEFEHGNRPHVSLDTALRLMRLVHVPVNLEGLPSAARRTTTDTTTVATTDATTEAAARAERAARRRQSWHGWKTTVAAQTAPVAPSSAMARLHAVASASRLVANLQAAHRTPGKTATTKRVTTKTTRAGG